MTEEMLDLARRNAAEAGVTNAEFLLGRIENIPLPNGFVDVVISNCVITLSLDKEAEGTAVSLTEDEYRAMLTAAGLTQVGVRLTHEVGRGLHATIIRAHKAG